MLGDVNHPGHPRITIDPAVCSGHPCIRGMRIRVEDVLSLLAAGETPGEILDEYPYLEAEDIPAAIAYARDCVAAGTHA